MSLVNAEIARESEGENDDDDPFVDVVTDRAQGKQLLAGVIHWRMGRYGVSQDQISTELYGNANHLSELCDPEYATDLSALQSAVLKVSSWAPGVGTGQWTNPATFEPDLGQNLEPDSGSNPAENQDENNGQSVGQTEAPDAPNDRETEGTDTTPASRMDHWALRDQIKAELRKTVKAKCDECGVSGLKLSTDLYGKKSHLGMLMAPSNKCSAYSLQEAIEKVKAYGTGGSTHPGARFVKRPPFQRVLPAMPGKTPDPRTAIVMEPARMAQAILAIAKHEDDAKAADEVGFVLPSSRAIAVIRAECTEWVAEAKDILEAILPPSEQRDRRIALQEKIRIFAGQKGGERIVVLLDPVSTPDAEEDGE